VATLAVERDRARVAARGRAFPLAWSYRDGRDAACRVKLRQESDRAKKSGMTAGQG